MDLSPFISITVDQERENTQTFQGLLEPELKLIPSDSGYQPVSLGGRGALWKSEME